MPAKDIFHDAVINALIKDGWTITHDPLPLSYGGKSTYVDLGAERLLGAIRGAEKIAVEVKSFVSASEMRDLEQALGQFILYRSVLLIQEPDRKMVIAVPLKVIKLFEGPWGKLLSEKASLQVIIYDHAKEVIVRWIP